MPGQRSRWPRRVLAAAATAQRTAKRHTWLLRKTSSESNPQREGDGEKRLMNGGGEELQERVTGGRSRVGCPLWPYAQGFFDVFGLLICLLMIANVPLAAPQVAAPCAIGSKSSGV